MKKIIIKYFLILGCLALLALIGLEIKKYQKIKPLCKNCNVLLISMDTLSAKHLPCYGYDKNTAPNLCQFGKDNILFTNSYSQSYWTRPSQTSVLTGLQPSTHGVMTPYIDKLPKKYKTIAEILKENGYKTYYYGPPVGGDSWDESVIRGFTVMNDNIYQAESLENWRNALDILEKNKKDKTPTFMYLHTYYDHAPYTTGRENLKFISKENMEKYPQIPLTIEEYETFTPEMGEFVLESLEQRVKAVNTTESSKKVSDLLAKFKAAKNFVELKTVFYNFPDNEIGSYERTWYYKKFKDLNANDYLESLYDERIYQMDTDLKSFLDKLKKKSEKDTIVIIFADHGETLGERGSYGHCEDVSDCLYMEITKVPLIIKVPGMKSKKIEELAQGIDIYPTILKLIGINPPDYIEGENLSELIRGTQIKSKKDYVVAESNGQSAMLIDQKWSLYSRDLETFDPKNMELYDLINDKNQLKNVFNKYPEIATERTNKLKKYIEIQNKNRRERSAFPDWIDNIKREKLIKQGYF